MIDAAPWVPVRSVRERVAQVAEHGQGEVREHAAFAAAGFGDPRAAVPLLAEIDNAVPAYAAEGERLEIERRRWRAAERLVGVDVAGVIEGVRQRCQAAPKDDAIRFFLALALAQAGEDEELRAFFADFERGAAFSDAEYWVGRLQVVLARSPFPETTLRWLSELALTGGGGDAGRLAKVLFDAAVLEPVEPTALGSVLRPSWAEGAPPGFTVYSASEMTEAKGALSAFGLIDDSGHLQAEAMAAALELGVAPAAVTVLFETAEKSYGLWAIGNQIVEWVHASPRRVAPRPGRSLRRIQATRHGHVEHLGRQRAFPIHGYRRRRWSPILQSSDRLDSFAGWTPGTRAGSRRSACLRRADYAYGGRLSDRRCC